MKKILVVSSLVFLQTCFAFSQIPLGKWRTHFSYNEANEVVFAEDRVYVEASNKLFSYSRAGDVEAYSTLSGLNDHNIDQIAWCDLKKELVIVYMNGNIDFLTPKGCVNLSDFKNKSLTVDKTVNSVRIDGNKAYLSTKIGLIILDVSKHEISNTYYLNFFSNYSNTYDAVAWNDTLLVATENGLFLGNTSTNLQDVSFWSSVSFVDGTLVKEMVRFAGTVFALADNGAVYKKSGSEWSLFLNDRNATHLTMQNNFMFVCAGNQLYMYDTFLNEPALVSIENRSVAYDLEQDVLYVASGSKGMSKLSKNGSGYVVSEDSVRANGPSGKSAWTGFFRNGVFYATGGGRFSNRYWNPGSLMFFKDEKWEDMINKENIVKETGIEPYDFLNVAVDPFDDEHFFVTSWGEGLYEFRNNVFYKLWNNENSPLVTCIPGTFAKRFVRVDGAVFDESGNLWILNSSSPTYNKDENIKNAIKILKPDSTWFVPQYSDLEVSETWNSILFTSNNQVWMNSARNNHGIFVLDYNQTLEDTSDDKTKWITSFTDQDGNVLSPWYIECMCEDRKGNIWIGTNDGLLTAGSVSTVFNSDFRFTRIKISRNDGTDNADFLLNGIRITSIAVDGANRKWIGTYGNGVYLVSADGLETVQQFDTENSPLPSDCIWSININPETGEVFFGTEAGLVSYRSDATEGKALYSSARVFPNPVKPDYVGVIAVTGLMENSQVKITDFAGNVLIKGTSLGGQFTWNGYTSQGRKATSGVYLVFCSSEDGSESLACKFMIVR